MTEKIYQPGLLYSVGPENRIGLVPASPLMLPFLLIWGIWSLVKRLIRWRTDSINSRPINIFTTRNVDPAQYQRDRNEFLLLTAKKHSQGLDGLDAIRLEELMNPWWALPHERPVIYK
jgi:hypothetical protein